MQTKFSGKRRFYEILLNTAMYACAAIIFFILFGTVGYIFYRGLSHINLSFLTTEPSFLKGTVGILPNILNTLYIIIITLAVMLPAGVGAAIYLVEYAKNKRIVKIISLAAETLAGIPSVIYGLIGILIFVQFFSLGTSLLAGALTLVIMTLPTVIRTTEESLKSVSPGLREGSLALGAGKWHMIRTVVLPCATDGIVTGCILSVGRIVGESAALLFTSGMANELLSPIDSITPDNSGATLTVAMYTYAKERGEFETAFAIAVILLFIVFIINFSAKFAAKILKKKGIQHVTDNLDGKPQSLVRRKPRT